MQYPTISRDGVKSIIDGLKQDIPWNGESHRIERDCGFFDIGPAVTQLQLELERLKGQFPSRLPQKGSKANEFEALASIAVHKNLKEFPVQVLADPGFWNWLAVARFRELISWRYSAEDGPAHVDNYGGIGVTENYMFRLWKRGQIGFEKCVLDDCSNVDEYAVARSGKIDHWRSHVFRQRYGRCEEIVRQIFLLQAGLLGEQPLDKQEIRWFAPALKRLAANVVLEYLDRDSARALVIEYADKSRAAVSKSGTNGDSRTPRSRRRRGS